MYDNPGAKQLQPGAESRADVRVIHLAGIAERHQALAHRPKILLPLADGPLDAHVLVRFPFRLVALLLQLLDFSPQRRIGEVITDQPRISGLEHRAADEKVLRLPLLARYLLLQGLVRV